jgi:hypothetical protein
MRIYEDRYTRERLRFHVALRFIRLEARTQTIRHWTGLTDDRIRKLYRSYLAHCGRPLTRHRGKSPQRPAYFTRSIRVRQESAVLASLYHLLGALPPQPAAGPARQLTGLQRGELLCQAYEGYRALITSPLITFEHAVFLLSALWSGEELVLSLCCDCNALLVADRWALCVPRCSVCTTQATDPQA